MTDEAFKDLQRLAERLQRNISRMGGARGKFPFRLFATTYCLTKLENPTLRSSTKRAFENQLKNHLIPAFGEMELEKITNAVWLKWVIKTKAITRFFNARKVLIEILTAAKEEGHLEKVPKFDNPDPPSNVGRSLEDREIIAILWRARRPFRFIFYAFWKMGCRPREILQWEWSMITWGEPGHTWIEIPARISKTTRARKIPLNPQVSHFLFLRLKRGGVSKFVFPARGSLKKPQMSYHSAWAGACQRARVKAVVYDLRRTFITRCAADGKPLIYVAKALDTSTKMIESVYAKAQVDVMEGIIK